MRRSVLLATAALVLGACGHEFHPPDSSERIREADEIYNLEMFDSLRWDSDSARSFKGNAVYAANCRRCHGTMGDGDTEYARGRALEVPSLVAPDWPLAASLDSLRHEIFAGHEGGMPGFGVAGITPREIDASAFFILFTLRPEVLESRQD